MQNEAAMNEATQAPVRQRQAAAQRAFCSNESITKIPQCFT